MAGPPLEKHSVCLCQIKSQEPFTGRSRVTKPPALSAAARCWRRSAGRPDAGRQQMPAGSVACAAPTRGKASRAQRAHRRECAGRRRGSCSLPLFGTVAAVRGFFFWEKPGLSPAHTVPPSPDHQEHTVAPHPATAVHRLRPSGTRFGRGAPYTLRAY